MAAMVRKPFMAISAYTAGASRHCSSSSLHRRFTAPDPFPGRRDRLQVFFQDHFHGRMGQDQFAQVTLMGRPPTALSLVTTAVTQEEAFETMARPAPVIHRIAPRPAQIAHRFIRGFGNLDRGQFTGPQQSRRFAPVAFVGFHSITRAHRRHRRGHYFAFHTQLPQAPRQTKTARPAS